MIGDHDHGVADEELATLGVGRKEGALRAVERLRAMHRHALAGQKLGQALDLANSSTGGTSQRCESSWKTTRPSAGAMPTTTSFSLSHSGWTPNDALAQPR